SEQMNKSSQSRMERMEAMNSGKKPDLQVLLKLDIVENEIVLAELGKVPVLGIQVIRDRVVVSALDLFEDDFYRVFRICELVIPLHISSRLIVEEFLKNALKMRFVVEKIIAMSVDVKDEISLLPVTENRTPSTSMMSTTYSPPKNL
ncbi:14899_t:CDS:2, partial [Cetraspora pellucida]